MIKLVDYQDESRTNYRLLKEVGNGNYIISHHTTAVSFGRCPICGNWYSGFTSSCQCTEEDARIISEDRVKELLEKYPYTISEKSFTLSDIFSNKMSDSDSRGQLVIVNTTDCELQDLYL